jgi:hypothetical protein
MQNNRRRRPVDNDSGNFFQGLAWGFVFSGLFFLVAYLIIADLERDSYKAPVDAAQQVEATNG